MKIEESFLKDSILTVIQKACVILSRRIGTKITVSPIPIDVLTSDGQKLSGVVCATMDGRQIRWNWKTKDTSCTIISVTYWTKIKQQPDIEIDLHDYNIVKILDVIAEVINNNTIGTVTLDESVERIEEGELSNEIKATIKAWSTGAQINDTDLENRRITELYNNYRYWYTELGGQEQGFKELNAGTFRNYILAYLEKFGLKNKFVKVLNSKVAGKEKIIVDDKAVEKKFNAEIFNMSLQDKKDFAEQSIAMLVQGLQNALIIGGSAGAGKTKLVNDTLNGISGRKIVKFSGGIKNTEELFKVFANNNDANTIIVFDDLDSIFDKKNLDIMKAVMSPDPKRFVTWYSTKINADAIVKQGDDVGAFIAKQQGIDVKKSNKKQYDPTFEFKSKILIITNLPKHKIHSALISRGTMVTIDFSTENILDDIRLNVEKIFPEYANVLTNQMKLEILDFLSEYVSEIFQIDYRLFKTVCCYRCLVPENPNWKKWAMNALRAVA